MRHRSGHRTYHLLPGGGVAYRETLEDALVREVAEETGLEVVVGPLVFASDTIDPEGPRHVVNLTFMADVVGGAITSEPCDPRVEGVEVVDAGSIADLDLRPPVADAILAVLSSADTAVTPGYLGSLFAPER